MGYAEKVQWCRRAVRLWLELGGRRADLPRIAALWWEFEGWRHVREGG